MQRKKYERMLFLSIFLIMIVYVAVLGIVSGIKNVGFAYKQDSVYEFLTDVKSHPDEYMLVIGSYAEDYEIIYGEAIAEFLGVRLRYEGDIGSSDNLLLIGTPATNLLLDKLLTQPYPGNEAIITLVGTNLLIVVNNELQAKGVSDVIFGFRKRQEKLSPATISFGFEKLIMYVGLFFAVLIPLIIIFVEKYRIKTIAKAQESNDEHKLRALEDYIRKYRKDGHPDGQIRQWLVNYEYDRNLVDKAMEAVKDAGADIST